MKKYTVILVILALCLAVAACAEPAEEEALLGEINGDTYENTVIGLGCTLEGWHYYSKDEILEVNQMTKDRLSEEVRAAMESSKSVNVMTAQAPDQMQNINIQLQTIGSLATAISSMGVDGLMKASLPQFQNTLESSGFADVDIRVGEVSISGQSFSTIEGSYTLNSYPLYFRQVWVFNGDYWANITDTTDDFSSYFYLLP